MKSKKKGVEKIYTYTVKIHPADSDETGYWAEVPTLPGCFTQGETYEETLAMAEESILLYLKGLAEEGLPIPLEKQSSRSLKVVMPVKLETLA